MENIDPILGKNLERIRKDKGMTREVLAEALGISSQQVWKYERGQDRLSGSRLWQLTDALGCNLLELFEGAPEPASMEKAS